MVSKKQIAFKYNLIIGLLVAIFLISGSFVAYYFIQSGKAQNDIKILRNQIERDLDGDSSSDSELNEQSDEKKLASYQKLYEQNNDMVGWIHIDDTSIDYPVMQTKTVKDYYLYKNFNEEYSVGGLPYVQENCDVFTPTDNVIIHGHHRADGTMFAALTKYKDKSFFEKHQIIEFDTIKECHKYQIIAVFVVQVNTGNDVFPYYEFASANSSSEFNDYVSNCKYYSLYDTGYTASYGDKLLTLSTCDYSTDEGRFVVVAKRIK